MYTRTLGIPRSSHIARLALAATVAALALAIGVARVSATPALTTPQNPVIIPLLGSQTKMIPVNWTLDAGTSATLQVKENGGPTLVNQPVKAPGGSAQVTVALGKSYTATLTGPGISATLVITTQGMKIIDPGPLTGDCSGTLCISSVTVTPHATSADFEVKTNEPAKVFVAVSTDPANANHLFDHQDSAAIDFSYATDFKQPVLVLKPGTLYHYVVRATDSANKTVYKDGTFTTKQAKVKVDFTNILILDDSDSGGACECYFTFEVDNLPVLQWQGSYNSGDSFNPDAHFTVSQLGSDINVSVLGIDDDAAFIVGWVCFDPPKAFSDNGSDSCADWSTARKAVPLAGLSETAPATISLTGDAGPLKFTVTAKLTMVAF